MVMTLYMIFSLSSSLGDRLSNFKIGNRSANKATPIRLMMTPGPAP
jgi:hypothetical protein